MDHMELQWRMLNCTRRFRELTEKRLQPFCAEHSLTPLGLRVLLTLHFMGPLTGSELARSTCIAGTNASSLCKKLEAAGLLCRQRSTADERQVVISLSATGRGLMEEFTLCYGGPGDAPDTPLADEITTILSGMESLLAKLEGDKENTA